MKRKSRFFLIGLLSVAMCAAMSIAVGCKESETTIVTPPEKTAKVYSVTISYNGEAIEGSLTVPLELGEVTVTASVRKDDGANGTVDFSSSVIRVAEISDEGVISLKEKGETVITASAGDKKHDIVLCVSDDSGTTGEKHGIIAEDCTTNVSSASLGEVISLTPDIPEDKEFLEWMFSDNVSVVNGNTFVMPDGEVTVKAKLVDKLASISVIEQPLDNKVTFGNPVNKEGLRIFAKSTISGEEWDVTNDCVISDFESDEYVTASYTLGQVTKTAQIPIDFVSKYTVTAASFKNPDNNYSKEMNEVPSALDDDFYQEYKDTGYICGTRGKTLKFSDQNGTYCASNFDKGQSLYFYFYSDFKATARIKINAASTKTYRTDGTTGTPDAVYETIVSDKLSVFFNESTTPVSINPNAKLEAFYLGYASWAVCGHFSEAWLADVVVEKGWNYLRFDSIDWETPNIEKIDVEFRNGEPVEFADAATTNLAEAKIMTEVPEDLDAALAEYKEHGGVYLNEKYYAGRQSLTVRQEGSHYSTACMRIGDLVRFYVYSEVSGKANLSMYVASGDTYRDLDGSGAPNGVKEVVIKNSFSLKFNGVTIKISDNAKAEAYRQDTGSWSVCQHFNSTEIATVEVQKGWNTIEFVYEQGLQANLADITLKYIYEE